MICCFCVRARLPFYAQAPDQDGAAAGGGGGGGERAGEIINRSTAMGQARKAAPANVRDRSALRFIYSAVDLSVCSIFLTIFLSG